MYASRRPLPRAAGTVRRRAAFVAAVLLTAACADSPAEPNAVASRRAVESASSGIPMGAIAAVAARRPIPNEYIVVLRDSVRDVHGQVQRLLAQAQGKPRFTYTGVLKGFAATMSAQAAAALARHPLVESVEQDQVMTADYVTQFPSEWGLDRLDETMLPLDGGYRYTATAPTVTAYIIDSGLQEDHPEWGARGWISYNTIDTLYADCRGHGTHVSGIVGGKTFGVAKNVLLRAVKVLRCDGKGTTSATIAGIDWVRLNQRQPAVTNISLGGNYSSSLNQAVRNLWNSGMFVAVAAGNSNIDACKVSPASAPEVMTVAASTQSDYRASFSNWGPCIDIYAPGNDIKSASTYNANGIRLSGTSQAAPFVTGVAALYKSVYPTATPAQVEQWIKSQALRSMVYGNPANTANLLLHKGTF